MRILSVLLITLGWTASLEIGLRLAGSHFTSSLYEPEAARGFHFRKNAYGWMVGERPVFVHINNIGYNDRNRSLAASVPRVAVVGDSNVASMYSSIEHGLTANIANQIPGFEVINFGTEGYNLAQLYLTLQNEVWAFHPTTVALVITPRSAIWRSVLELNPDHDLPYPYFDYRDSNLALIPGSHPSERKIQVTSLWRSIVSRFQLLALEARARTQAKEAINSLKPQTDPPATINIKTAWMHPPDSAITKKAWRISEDTIHLIATACEAHGAQLFIVVFDDQTEVMPDVKERDKLLKTEKVPDFGYTERRLRDIANREGACYFALGPQLGEYAARTGHMLHGYPGGQTPPDLAHLNDEGNAVAGRLIGNALRQTLNSSSGS